MYPVAVCSACRNCAWIINAKHGMPKTSKCRKCGKRRKIQKLNRISKPNLDGYPEDKEMSKLVRTATLAEMRGQQDGYKQSLDNGDLTINWKENKKSMGSFLEERGLDVGEMKDEVEDQISSASPSTSQRDIMMNAFQEQDEPSMSDIIEYASNNGMSPEKAEEKLDDLLMNGKAYRAGNSVKLI